LTTRGRCSSITGRFARSDAIDIEHFVVFKYDDHDDFSIEVFDDRVPPPLLLRRGRLGDTKTKTM
jgi:hypothetical protein